MNHEEESRPLLAEEENTEHRAEDRSETETYLNNVKNGKLYMATFAAVLGPLSFGFVLGYSSPAIPDLQKIPDPRLRLTAEEGSWFGSVVTIGAGLGGLLGGWVVEKIGRKLSLMFCALPFIFGFTVIIAAQNHWMLYVGRVLTGVASGVTSLVVPLYISETSHERVRGTMGSCVQLMVVTGIMGAYITGLFLDWRWLAVTSSIPPTLMLVCMCFMPETPRYLLSRGKRSEAEEALRFLRGRDTPVEWECARIEAASRYEEGSLSLADLKDPGVYKPLGVGIMMMLLQQFTGINAIMFYAQTIFELAHFQNGSVASVFVGATQVIFTAVAALVMDRAGRKVLLILSGVAMCVSEAAFGIYFKVSTANHGNATLLSTIMEAQDAVSEAAHTDLSWLALTSMGIFITGFALGWGPIPWLVMSEIFPTKARGLGSAACVLTNWTCAFIVTKTFQNLTFAGEWYRVGLAYDHPFVIKYKKNFLLSRGNLIPNEDGGANLTMWSMNSQKTCDVSFYVYEKTELPGAFTYFSQRHKIEKDITVVETNYTDYGVVLKYKNINKEYTQLALYGRKPEVRPEVVEKFRSFALSIGFPEEAIITPTILDPCPLPEPSNMTELLD